MNKIFILILLPLLSSAQAFGQGQKYAFAEIGGPSVFTSVNFDMRFNPGSRDGWGARIGAGHSGLLVEDGSTSAFVFPVGINYLYDKNRRGLLFGLNASIPLIYEKDVYGRNVEIIAKVLIVPEIGYRYSPTKSGIGFHLSYTPLFRTVDGTMPFFLGAGIGYSWR